MRSPVRFRRKRPFYQDKGVKLYSDDKNASALKQAVGKDATLAGYLRAHVNRLKAGDYFAVLAYIERNEKHQNTASVHTPERSR